MGTPYPRPQRGGAKADQIFGPCLLWPNGLMDEAGTWTEVGLSPGDFVLDGDPAPSPKRGRSPPPQFSAHFYCGQTAGCIKMPFGMDVGPSPGDFAFDGDPVPFPKTGAEPPIFRPIFIVAKRLDGSRCHLAQR